MCGIFGCILDNRLAAPVIRTGLKRLEYRGYDSVGEATISKGQLFIKKDAGKIDFIHKKLNLDNLPGNIGIGHTRWATHGAPEKVNAHPHTDCLEELAVVHNGIIENYVELREELEKKGHKFQSRTDTEVIPHLIEEELRDHPQLFTAVYKSIKKLRGSYSIAVLYVNEPDIIVCARKESPLIIGIDDESIFCASDIPAFLPLTNKALILEDDEIAVLKKGEVQLFDAETGETKHREAITITWTTEMAEKGGYSHFMLKEIHEQILTLRNVLRTPTLYYDLMANSISAAKNIFLIACGTSYHACVSASYLFSKLTHLDVHTAIASEFIEQHGDSINRGSIIIAVSQSGETADTLNAVRYAKNKGAEVLGITNTMGSTLTRLSSVYIGRNSGPEIGVAATKTFTSQLMVLSKIAITIGLKRGIIPLQDAERLKSDLTKMPETVDSVIKKNEDRIKALVKKYRDTISFCFLGRGINYATALEGRLKLLEIAYSPSLAYPAGESKHGFIAIIQKNYPAIFIAPMDQTHTKIIGNIMELKARGADIIAIIDEKDEKIKNIADEYIEVTSGISNILTPIAYVVPLQLFAHYMATERGLDPDQPRNLAKSVTVL
jgi:glucosamine--fructose-6-phosphate aminotransferase (isomerizing)